MDRRDAIFNQDWRRREAGKQTFNSIEIFDLKPKKTVRFDETLNITILPISYNDSSFLKDQAKALDKMKLELAWDTPSPRPQKP